MTGVERIVIGDTEFARVYPCDFKPHQREVELDAEVEKYYGATHTCSNKTAAEYRKEFRQWCVLHGYSIEEINNAKKRVAHRLGI